MPDQEYASVYEMLEHALTADADENDFAIHRVLVSLSPGATLVLCSDGIHEKLGEERLWLYCPKKDFRLLRESSGHLVGQQDSGSAILQTVP